MKIKISKIIGKWWMIAIFLLIFSIPAVLKLISPGFYEPHDLHHFADIYEMFRAFASGQIPPRWGPDYLYNFGYPLFNFYYVLPFYLGAGFFVITGSLQWAFKLVFVLSILLSVVGMYLLIKEFAGKFAAVVGSVLFLYTPYRAVQIYVRGAMGEALSLALTPLVAYLLIKIVNYPDKFKIIGLGGLIGGAFILSHNYMSFLSFPWIIILALIFINGKENLKTLKSLLIAGLLMMGASAYWWYPALIEQNLITPQTPFPLLDHFPFIKQLIIPSWGYGSSLPGPYDGLSFQIGVVNLLVFISVVILVLFFRKYFKDKKLLYIGIWGTVSFLIMFFMMNIRTYPIWKIIPFHDFIQFPWRLLSFTTFFTAVLAAVLVEAFKGKLKIIAGLLIIILSIALTFNYFKPSGIFHKTDNEYLARFFASRTIQGTKDTVSKGYLEYSEDYLLLPKTDKKKPDFLPKAKFTSDTAKISNIQEISAVSFAADIDASESSEVSFNSMYFPGWVVKVDGHAAQISPGNPYGQVTFGVTKGTYRIEANFQETQTRRISDFASLGSVILAILFSII